MKVTIEVTPEDIVDGERFNSCRCPIALATKRVLPDRPVDVHRAGMIVGGDEIKLPWRAQDFIARFDDEKPVDPITFEIEVSDDEAAA